MSTIMDYIIKRQLDMHRNGRLVEKMVNSMYSNINATGRIQLANLPSSDAINNMVFSPNGRLLVAVTADRRIIFSDPTRRKIVNAVFQAHERSVNCVCFLNDEVFATGGDDGLVRVWDSRIIRPSPRPVAALTCSGGWVKSVSCADSILVAGSLDGAVMSWDSQDLYLARKNIAHLPGLVRANLSNDGKKLALSFTGGYIIVIHNFNIDTIGRKLFGFQPVIYRCMYSSKTPMPSLMKYDYLFDVNRKENRLEFIDDWPPKAKAELITSLQFHPQDHYLMSRNINRKDCTEHTCIHDLEGNGYWYPKKANRIAHIKRTKRTFEEYEGETFDAFTPANREQTGNRLDILQSLSRLEESSPDTFNRRRYTVHSSGIPPPDLLQPSGDLGRLLLLDEPATKMDDFKPVGPTPPETYYHKRLINYRKERRLITAHHTIRENAWSSDGSVIAAPSRRGVRLYTFDRSNIDLPYLEDDIPIRADQIVAKKLQVLCDKMDMHNSNVVCTRFRPHYMQLASGCHLGHIVWYDPVLGGE